MPKTRMIRMAGGAEGPQHDYIEPGSEEHAGMLGLRKWAEGDDPALNVEGWTFQDATQFGPLARVEYIRASLAQRVAELRPMRVEVREAERASRTWVEKGVVHIEAPRMFDPERERRERGQRRA